MNNTKEEEEEHPNKTYRNMASLQIDRPDKGINDLLNEIIPRNDMDVSGSLGVEQKDEEVRSPQRKKKKNYKRKDKKIKTRRQKQSRLFAQEGLERQ